MPADVVVGRQHSPRHPTLDFDPRYKGVDQFLPRGSAVLCQREQCGRYRSAGMDQGVGMGVVEVENMRSNPIHQRCMHDVRSFLSSQQGRLRGASEGTHCAPCVLHSLVATGANRAPGPVDERAAGLVNHRGGQTFVAACHTVASQQTRGANIRLALSQPWLQFA